jgi:hypothetical protein
MMKAGRNGVDAAVIEGHGKAVRTGGKLMHRFVVI